MLSGEVNLIAGVRRILSLSAAIGDIGNEVFIPIRAIDSETDHFPLGDVRLNWEPSALSRVDVEMKDYLADAKEDILRSCQEIVQLYSVKRDLSMHEKIKNVLMQDWDPIGVQEIPEAQDEYDNYVPMIYSMLISRKPVNEVLEYLLWLEGEHMGLTVDHQRTQLIAEKLVSLE